MELLAVSTGVAIAYGIGLWVVLIVGPATVTALKGRWALFAAGWLTLGMVWWITALRLARPGLGGLAISTARTNSSLRSLDTARLRTAYTQSTIVLGVQSSLRPPG